MRRQPGWYRVRTVFKGWIVAEFANNELWYFAGSQVPYCDCEIIQIGERVSMPDDDPPQSKPVEQPITLDDLRRVAKETDHDVISIYDTGIAAFEEYRDEPRASERIREILKVLDAPPPRTALQIWRGEKK